MTKTEAKPSVYLFVIGMKLESRSILVRKLLVGGKL